uniref:RecT protein n=1 Tax=Siphoviridae sp. ctnMR5 TaxID=2825658 RepID=A0A8S5U8T1_9CAUD|nr:MAG TPA: RecT protein [Siphoviridae sp. ctnMR5]
MAVNNSLAVNNEKRKFSTFLNDEKVQKFLVDSLGNEKAKQDFVSNITSAVSANPSLRDCDFSTIVSSGLLATSLNLPLSPALGFAHLIPYKDRGNNRIVATFVPGYRGYIQLAIRSGYYADIDVFEVRQGEYLGRDMNTGKYRFKFIEDDDEREELPVVGYMAMFEHLNGFKKVLYWSKKKMLKYADTYVPAFSLAPKKGRRSYEDFINGKVPENELWKYSSYWYKDFDAMAKKTLIRQLISKWGIMSIEMQRAYDNDTKAMESESTFMGNNLAEEDFFGSAGNDEEKASYTAEEIEQIIQEQESPKKSTAKKKAVVAEQENFFNETE